MPEINHYHPDDKLHVLLDAIAFARGEIEGRTANGTISRWHPWEDYQADDPEAPDAKSTRDGWLAVLAWAELDVTRKLDTGAPL